MFSLMNGMFEPSTSHQDKTMFMTSLALNVSLNSDGKNTRSLYETIINLTSASASRHDGLQLLELTLQQNTQNIYTRVRWVKTTYEVIRDPKIGSVEKMQACKVLALIIPNMATDSSFEKQLEELTSDIYPLLLKKIGENVEWTQEACICVKICLENFPSQVAFYQIDLLDVILHQASHCVSSKSFEILAECFSELPNCVKENDGAFKDRWKELFLRTLKTIDSLLASLLINESYSLIGIEAKELIFKEEKDGSDFIPDYAKRVRRFVNLCKCLAKLLSLKSRYPVKVPVFPPLKVLFQLFSACKKDTYITPKQEILFTFIAQMKLGGIAILESLILNCPLLKYTGLMSSIMRAVIDSSSSAISAAVISELRIASWKIFSLWLDGYGPLVAKEIIIAETSNPHILQELIIDTSLGVREALQDGKTIESKEDLTNISLFKQINAENICAAALDSLDSFLSAGVGKMSKGIFQEICSHIFKMCESIDFDRYRIPHPYTNESLRVKLYTVVLTIIENVKPDDHQTLQTAMKILRYINQDPSYKVKKICHRASAICRLQFYPNRQLSVFSDTKRKLQTVLNDNTLSIWSSKEYAPNLNIRDMSENSDNLTIKIDESFAGENEIEVHSSEEFMDFTEQVVENQCNGEDIEIQNSSQCQDDVDSDEEEEEEEEEEERCFADEEMNQAPPTEYIPATPKIQTPPPVQINTETVQSTTEPEYEELAPCIKAEENIINSSNKNNCLNGEKKVVHDENMPSSSTQKTNENGIFGIDDDDLDEDEEENGESYPAEKRVESYDQPAPKKQKTETKDDAEERREKEKSPTLEEMKADFLEILPSIEDVKSGKVQLSSP